MQVFLTLPAYNEEQALPLVLDAFAKQMRGSGFKPRAVVVDDGSTDRTAQVAREWASRLHLDLVQHPQNRGLGETIEDALRRAAELAEPDDIVVTMDADNTHSPALIPQMIARLDEGYDIVIASRYREGSQVLGLSGFRHMMSFGARILFQVAYPTRGVRDYTSGFRAYRARVLQEWFAGSGKRMLRERGFAAMAEILLHLRKRSIRMSEVPMVLRYDQKLGAGKMHVGRTVWKTLVLVGRHRLGA